MDKFKIPGSRLAIVGSHTIAFPDAIVDEVVGYVLSFYQPRLVVSGGAEGVDERAVAVAKRRGIETQEFFPRVKRSWGGPGGFKERNMKIAESCDGLVRIIDTQTKTYGSGWTRDYAKEIGKFTLTIVILQNAELQFNV